MSAASSGVASGSASRSWRDAVGDTAQHGVRERDGTLEARAANELDGLVDRRVPCDAVDESELVRAEPERRSHGRVEAAQRSPPERLDRMVERARALNGAEREPLRERAIAFVETGRGAAKGAIRVRVVLEDAQEDVERRDAGGAYARRPRSHASYAIRRPPSG